VLPRNLSNEKGAYAAAPQERENLLDLKARWLIVMNLNQKGFDSWEVSHYWLDDTG